MTAFVCANCGKSCRMEVRAPHLDVALPWDDDGKFGCVHVKDAPHPCGGTYDISDYHAPARGGTQ